MRTKIKFFVIILLLLSAKTLANVICLPMIESTTDGGGVTITVDATSSTNGYGSSVSHDHTTSADASMLAIFIGCKDTSAVDFSANPQGDGNAMTQAVHEDGNDGTRYIEGWIWYLDAPPTGEAVTITATFDENTNWYLTVISYEDTTASAPEATASGDETGDSWSLGITTLTDGAEIFGGIVFADGGQADPIVEGAGQTAIAELTDTQGQMGGYYEEKTTAGLETWTWTTDTGDNYVGVEMSAAFK